MPNHPRFLTVSQLEQRAKFREISAYCEAHLSQALEPTGTGRQWSVTAAFNPRNRSRNRYTNVLPWDRTRVHLPSGTSNSDYVNASFVNLSSGSYIAAQGPLKSTVHHFWAMCFSQAEQSGSSTIVVAMLTPLVEQNREKCFPYWPTKNDGMWNMSEAVRSDGLALTDLRITCLSEEKSPDCVVSVLSLESNGVSKTVYHYYYVGWQDTRTPDSVMPLIQLSANVSSLRKSDPDIVPIVHCSAGVGRTGTYISIDHFLNTDLASTTESDIVFDTVKTLRDHRMMMVQTSDQYCFLYQVAKDIYKASEKGQRDVNSEEN